LTHFTSHAEFVLLSQKEHEESVKALKLQLETSSKPQDASSSAQSEALQAQLAQALAEVGSLKEQLQSSQTASNAMKAQQATAAPPVASNAASPGGDVAQITVERDRAIANLASQSQAWNVEKEDLKKQLEKMKSDFSAKLAAADKTSGTPGGPADAESASRLQKLDAILKESIKNGDLRGAAVDQVGKVKLLPRTISPAVVFSCSAPHFFERF
jgi:hypothetical protein